MIKMKSVMMVAAMLVAGPALAQVSLDNKVMKESAVRGQNGAVSTTVVPAKNITPGNVAVYVMTYKNGTRAPVSNLVINNKVPSSVRYMGPAAGTPAPLVSIDGGKTYGQLTGLTLRTPQGIARAAQFSDVTDVRWTIQGPVAPGSSGSVSYRARVQ